MLIESVLYWAKHRISFQLSMVQYFSQNVEPIHGATCGSHVLSCIGEENHPEFCRARLL